MSRQQQWAAAAHKQVKAFAGDKDAAKLKTLCMKAPGLIHQSGLAQALAFLRSRDGIIGKTFVDAIADVYAAGKGGTQDNLVNRALTTDDLAAYMALTADVADVAAWMRRFAQIELKGVDEADPE